MYSDDSSFGWVSLDEGEEKSSLQNCDSEANVTMVKLEKNVEEDESNTSSLSKPAKFGNENVNQKVLKTIKQDKDALNSVPPQTIRRKSEPRMVSFSTISMNNSTSSCQQNNGAILDQYTKSKDLRLIKDIGSCDVTEEDDVWLLQCPRNIDINSLVGVNFLQKDKKKFKIGKDSYECVSSPKNPNEKISILTPPTWTNDNYKLNCFDLSGIYFIREKMSNANEIEVCEQPTEKVPFPTNLKKRHPLLGDRYKHLLKIPPSVKEKLNNPNSSLKESKKINGIKVESEEVEVLGKVGKKRKAQHLDTSLEPPKKVKKESANMWTSELSIEKSLFELPIKSSKKKSNK